MRVIIPSISDVIEFYLKRFDVSLIVNNKNWFDIININNLFEYICEDKWDKSKISELITTIEMHLTKFLHYYHLKLDYYLLKNGVCPKVTGKI